MGINIQYKPTGFIFDVSKEEADRLLLEEPENFKAMDEDYKAPEVEEEETEFIELVKDEPKEEKAAKKPAKKAAKKAAKKQ